MMSKSPGLHIKKRILVPLPDYGFDPTEAAIPWTVLTENGHDVFFATPSGYSAMCDVRMLKGEGLGIWKPLLMANKKAVAAYGYMSNADSFCNPFKYTDLQHEQFDALLLPGGHDKDMKVYLESSVLQEIVCRFFLKSLPVAAICHGVVLAARSKDPDNHLSVLYNYKTTALLQSQELMAYQLTRLWLKDYYLTYPVTVEKEVTDNLANPGQFIRGPFPFLRDEPGHLNRGFSLRDRNYLSARWPGDAWHFSNAFLEMLNAEPSANSVLT